MNTANEFKSGQPSILMVTRNLPPLRGGMERLNKHIAAELSSTFSLRVIGPKGCSAFLPSNVEAQQVPVRPLAGFFARVAMKVLRYAMGKRADIVFAGSGLMAPFAVVASWLSRAQSVAYLHGLDIIVDSPIYQALWIPFLRRCDLCIVNSRNTARLAVAAGVLPERLTIIHPGVSAPLPGDGQSFRQRHEMEHARILLSVGRLTPRKGVHEFVRYALPEIVAAHPNAVLLIVGDDARDALSGGGEGGADKVRQAAAEFGLERHVRLVGALSDEELSAAYAAADLCIFPVLDKPGDVEGFGMVAVEAAAHGLPTLAFDTGGIPDAVSPGVSGWLVPAGSYPAMAQKAIQFLDSDWSNASRQECKAFAAGFEWQHFGELLRNRLHGLIEARERS